MLLTLMILFQIKHFICDYPLQTPYMLGKLQRTDWIKPLLAHASVHGLGTFLIVAYFNLPIAFILAVADVVLHFVVDRLKASPDIGGHFSIDNKYFWWCLGLDQMAHQLTYVAFIVTIFNY